ncbi:peptidase family C78-domain-containing protein [Schizophyllum fasciatum]
MNWKTRDSGFWYPGLPTPPPPSFTPGVIPLLKRILRRSIERGKTRRAVLCDDRATHVSNEMFDRTWGCGYRNFLMACTVLMVQANQPYSALLQRPLVPPSVRNLQRWIEEAWAAGFDAEGAQQLKKLVGTGKWIGTADLWVALACRGIPAELVDFDLKHQANADILVQWIKKYFEPQKQLNATDVHSALMDSPPIISTDKMPIILQYNGHSQTIIGVEELKDGSTNLLTLDPGRQAALVEAGIAAPLQPSVGAEDTLNAVSPSSSEGSQNQPHHPHAHKIKNFIQHGPLRKHGSLRQTMAQSGSRHEAGAGPSAASKSPRPNDQAANEENLANATPRRGNALAPRGGSSAPGVRPKPDLDLAQTMRFFRKDAKQLDKKDSYQILYFPLTAPLTEAEKARRRVVYSTRVC